MSQVLARRDDAFSPEETEQLLRERLGDAIVGTHTEYATFTVEVANESFAEVAEVCRDERVLAYDFFDCLFGVDAREEGFDVVAVLYSTSTGNRICLRTRCPGGREEPTCPTLTGLYRGADWHERETWDMFGVEFTDHPGLEPRILTVENFEGFPLRKDFHLASRVVKPWPGVKEPAELDEDGNVIERVPRIGDAPGPYELDKAMAEQAKLANPAPDTPAETEEGSQEKSEPEAEGEDKTESGIDQETYDALIAEGKSERIARSKAKAAFVKKQRQQAADDASDQATETESEDAEAQATEVAAEAAEQAEFEQREAAAEQVEADEVPSEEAESAADKAEAKRREAAEARARKAEERARDAEQDDDADEREGEGDA